MDNNNNQPFTNNTLLWLLIGAIASVTGGIIILWGVSQREHSDTIQMLRYKLRATERRESKKDSLLIECYEGRTRRAESAADWAREKFSENEKDTTIDTATGAVRGWRK